jgi:hypothetical protein
MSRRSMLIRSTTMFFLVAVNAFNLGRYAVEFRGGVLAWMPVILSALALAICFIAQTLVVRQWGANKQD